MHPLLLALQKATLAVPKTTINYDTQDIVSPDKQILQEDVEPSVDDELIEKALSDLFDKAEKEDETLRYRLIQIWKRNDYYFNNIQNIFFDAEARDYRTIDNAIQSMVELGNLDDIKTINIYRAFAESIISALSVQPPNVNFNPDDADDPEDLETAEAYSKIEELIKRHNHAPLMLIKALTTLYNQGVIAAHNYYKTDPSYGTYRVPKTIVRKENTYVDAKCPQCGDIIDSHLPVPQMNEMGQMPSTDIQCPQCGFHGPAEMNPQVEYIDEVSEYSDNPKGRSGFDIFGPTYVKMPLYARRQEHLGYLILRLEDNVAKFRAVYDDPTIQSGGGDTYKYERWGRIPPEYYGTLPVDIATARYAWFRPWYYYTLEDEDLIEALKSRFPKGVKATKIENDVLEYEEAELDDEWTVSFDPRANFIHAEPHGNAVIPIQDAKNDIFNLGLQSIEYGIPETFANPKTLNFQKYNQTRSTPGMVTPALPPGPDKSLADGFYSVKTATLSNEYIEFDSGIDRLGQFISAAMPSIWGGVAKAGETTATESSDTKATALQRLQILWNIVSVFWAQMMAKCVADFAKNMKEDERFTKKENGSFINVWIEKSSLNGKIGDVEPEINGQIPQSWAQKKEFIMGLINMAVNSPQLTAILMHPSNVEIIKLSTGMPDFYVPGEYDRNKQWSEYYILSNGGQVSVDIDVDDHQVHQQVLKNILVSPVGLMLYRTNAKAYQSCIMHYREHEMALQAHTAAASGTSPQGQPPNSATEAG